MEASRKRMVDLLEGLILREGLQPSPLDGVALLRADRCPRSPVLCEPSLMLLARGRQHTYLGDQVHTCDRETFQVLTTPLPLECAVEPDADGSSLLGLVIRLDPAVISELMLKMDLRTSPSEGGRSLATAPMHPALGEAVVRLLEALSAPMDCRVLGPQILREIAYRVLGGERGTALGSLLAMTGSQAQIHRIMLRIHARYAEPMEVAALAMDAGMSVSAFHHHFKAVAATSPLQYLKAIRLHKARLLMVQEAVGASVAADRVGYESPSQFSREFKRLFGTSPKEEVERLRRGWGARVPSRTTAAR